tara:strand:- start:131 stop:520 length:390 start_codon:yes stop_codon:yes gene_type:complete
LGTYSPWEKGKNHCNDSWRVCENSLPRKIFFSGSAIADPQTHRHKTTPQKDHRADHTTEQTQKKHWSDFADFVKCRPRKQTQNTDQKQTRKRPRIQTEKDPEFRQKTGTQSAHIIATFYILRIKNNKKT